MPVITRWFYLPSLLFLLLALLSGTWLRLQWGWPHWQILGLDLPWSLFFRADYLIHGHSHVALLGWTFLALAGFVLEAGTRRNRLPIRTLKVLAALTILVTILLFIAFVRNGYAPLSIALSTIHMLLGYVLAWIFFRHARIDSNTGSRYFLEGAVFWMVMATAGPWLLAAGRGLSPFWLDAAVQYYLHVLFNGWLLFGLAGLSFHYLVKTRHQQQVWPFWMMMVGLLPALLPQLGPQTPEVLNLPGDVITVLGVTGSLLFAAGGLAVVWLTVVSLLEEKKSKDLSYGERSQKMRDGVWQQKLRMEEIPQKMPGMDESQKMPGMDESQNLPDKKSSQPGNNGSYTGESLLWIGLGGSVPVLLLPVFMAWPPVRDILIQSDFLVVGFIHLHLLVMTSSLLLFGIIQQLEKGRQSARSHQLARDQLIERDQQLARGQQFKKVQHTTRKRSPLSRFIISRQSLQTSGFLFYGLGSLAMTGVLIVTGGFQIFGMMAPYPVQKVLFFAGLAVLAGTLMLVTSLRIISLSE